VVVVNYSGRSADLWWEKNAQSLARSRNLTVLDVSADTVAELGIGMGKLAQPLRVAITGTQVSPSIDYTVYLAGRDQALKRIDAALQKIADRTP
jgi:glutamyl-tRNA synthetase